MAAINRFTSCDSLISGEFEEADVGSMEPDRLAAQCM